MKTSIIKNKNQLLYLIGIGLLLISWSLISYLLNQPILIPTPLETLEQVLFIVRSIHFHRIIAMTFARFLAGFALTMTLAALLGILAGLSQSFAMMFAPFISLIKAVPTMAIILLAIIWLKSDIAPVLVIFLISYPVLFWSWKSGIEQTDRKLLEMAKLFRVKKSKVLSDIYLPSAKPFVLSGVSSALGLGFKVGIGAEVLCQPRLGIGTAFQIEKSNLNTAGVFAWAIICVVMVGLMDYAVKKAFPKPKR